MSIPRHQRTLIVSAVVTAGTLLAVHSLGGACFAGDSSCCEAWGGPGCDDPVCQAAVCDIDGFCCAIEWDSICASEAHGICFTLCSIACDTTCPSGSVAEIEACGEDLNGGCNARGTPSSCCSAGTAPGCDDLGCAKAVCAIDSFCCTSIWDASCAEQAHLLCGALCAISDEVQPIACDVPVCGTFAAENGIRDTDWYSFTVSSTSAYTWSVSAGVSVTLAIVNDGCPPFYYGLTSSSGCPSELSACLEPGEYRAFVAPDLYQGLPCGSGEANHYVATLHCGGACVPLSCGDARVGDCCSVSPLPYCQDASCCETVCAVDVFCCSLAWDVACVSEANALCPGLCSVPCDLSCPEGSHVELEQCGEDTNGGCNSAGGSGSTCCTPWGGQGCDDLACQTAVCEHDPVCCEILWDETCVAQANELCGTLCASHVPYESISCGTTVCGTMWADGGSHDSDWYAFTLSEPAVVTWTVTTLNPVKVAFYTAECPPSILNLAINAGCPFELTQCLGAGNYVAMIEPLFISGLPCGTGDGNRYLATLTCGPECVPLVCGGATAGDCCVGHEGPFCNDADCCALVCEFDPWCCISVWDEFCALDAAGLCAACVFDPPANDGCEGASSLADGSQPFTTQGATGLTNVPESCGFVDWVSIFNDVWFRYDATATGTVTVSVCNSASFDTRLAVFEGSCAEPTIVGCNDDAKSCAALTSEVTFAATCGTTYLIVLGAYNEGVTGVGTISVTPSGTCGQPCITDLSGDGLTGGADLAILLGAWGETGVAADFNGGGVDASDLAVLLGAWGPCP